MSPYAVGLGNVELVIDSIVTAVENINALFGSLRAEKTVAHSETTSVSCASSSPLQSGYPVTPSLHHTVTEPAVDPVTVQRRTRAEARKALVKQRLQESVQRQRKEQTELKLKRKLRAEEEKKRRHAKWWALKHRIEAEEQAESGRKIFVGNVVLNDKALLSHRRFHKLRKGRIAELVLLFERSLLLVFHS